jgi:hypothetical protein
MPCFDEEVSGASGATRFQSPKLRSLIRNQITNSKVHQQNSAYLSAHLRSLADLGLTLANNWLTAFFSYLFLLAFW